MKTRFVLASIFTAIGLIGTPIFVNDSASAKSVDVSSGQKCTKVGKTTKLTSGKILVCTKVGKKKVWKLKKTSAPSVTLSGNYVIVCQENGAGIDIQLISALSGQKIEVVSRKNPIFTTGSEFNGSCRMSSDLSRELGDWGGLVRTRNISNGAVVNVPFNVSTGGFNDGPLPTSKSHTICGTGVGIIYSLASDGWLYKESGSTLVRFKDYSSYIANQNNTESIEDLVCIGSDPALAIRKTREISSTYDENYEIIQRLDGSRISLNDIGGACNLLDTQLGECPTTGLGDSPTAFVRQGDTLYFAVAVQGTTYLWKCVDTSAFRACTPTKLAPFSSTLYEMETVGFWSNGLATFIDVHP